jgi:hypothetical protein
VKSRRIVHFVRVVILEKIMNVKNHVQMDFLETILQESVKVVMFLVNLVEMEHRLVVFLVKII